MYWLDSARQADVNKRDIRIVKLNASNGDKMWDKIYDMESVTMML